MKLATLKDGSRDGRLVVVSRDLRQALEDGVQSFHSATPDAHLSQKQVGQNAKQREHPHDDDPGDSGSGVAMGPKQDPHEDRQLNRRDDGKRQD